MVAERSQNWQERTEQYPNDACNERHRSDVPRSMVTLVNPGNLDLFFHPRLSKIVILNGEMVWGILYIYICTLVYNILNNIYIH